MSAFAPSSSPSRQRTGSRVPLRITLVALLVALVTLGLLATGYAELPPDAAPGLPRLSKPFLQAELARAIGEVMQPAP